MKTTRKDDRTNEQMITHRYLVTATDKFLSGWGGVSKFAWACSTIEQQSKLYDWVEKRSDVKYVNIHFDNWYPKAAYVHIYVVEDNHPALK